MCGDSTSPTDLAKLMNGQIAVLLHADPPYGMGKEKDGVLNDNLYASKLDQFQLEWWSACRRHIADNASAYIWGNAEDLWRLWYSGGLKDLESLTFRNEIVWSKPAGFGQSSELMRSYSPNTERCLFFMLGEQGFNNNADNYWEGWEPIRTYLDGERKKSGLTTDECNKICGKTNMTQSAFTKGGFRLILKEDYEKLKAACNGKAFKREYEEIKCEYEEIKREFYSTRAYFDNAHDNMNEVWQFNKVSGDERHGHATPKPVDMIGRAIKSSAPTGGLVLEPFGGSGSTLIAAHQTNRVAYLMELDTHYVDVICARFQKVTGIKPVAESTGREHDFLDV
jgi:DNA modification methylase